MERCNLCKRPFADARFMIDAHLKEGIGACVCAVCFAEHGIGLRCGKGQLYERTSEGWLLVAGRSDEDTDRREALKAWREAWPLLAGRRDKTPR